MVFPIHRRRIHFPLNPISTPMKHQFCSSRRKEAQLHQFCSSRRKEAQLLQRLVTSSATILFILSSCLFCPAQTPVAFNVSSMSGVPLNRNITITPVNPWLAFGTNLFGGGPVTTALSNGFALVYLEPNDYTWQMEGVQKLWRMSVPVTNIVLNAGLLSLAIPTYCYTNPAGSFYDALTATNVALLLLVNNATNQNARNILAQVVNGTNNIFTNLSAALTILSNNWESRRSQVLQNPVFYIDGNRHAGLYMLGTNGVNLFRSGRHGGNNI